MSHRNNDDYDDQDEGRMSEEGSEDGQSPVMNGTEHLEQVEDDENNAYATVAAVASDPKKEKEEKKRLEKERKEREKQEKEEAKRQKKEEQKQKKEEQKQQQQQESGDSAAPSRRAEREAKKKLKVPSIFSQKKPGVRPKHGQKCRVLLLDGTDLEVNLDRYAYGQHLFDTVCEYVDLLERDYFSLTYQDRHGIRFWLIHDRRIIKQLEEGIEWIFEFHVKFYSPEPGMLQEDITRYQLCLQLRNDILSGQLPCSFVTYALLGSYTVQSELGNYDYEEMGSGIDYIRDIEFSPNQTDDLLEKIAELHRTHYGQSPAEAEIHFLENAKKLLLYGIHLHPAKDAELVDIMIGVSAAGITVFRDGLKINRFIWPKILKIAYKKKTFYLKIRAGEFEHFESTVGFKLASHRLTKRLWRMAIETHTFFRLKEPLPIPTGVFSQFGSKFRFSGRTHYQSRLASSEIDRQAPYFERNSTRRLSASRSMDHGNSSFDRSGAHLSKSMDYMERRTKKSYNEYDDFSPGASNVGQDGKQVSVLAGTGPDASRVAYVKTIKPGTENETAGLDASQDGRYEEPFFEEGRSGSPHASGFVSEETSGEGTRKKKKKKQSQSSTTKTVTAAIERNVSFDDESLPPYPNVDESFQSPTEMNTSLASTGEPKKRKPKKKTTTTTTKTSKKTYMDDEGNVVTEVQYKTEKNGFIETRLEQVTSFDETDIDHDLALANAIQNVTEVNPDLAVEKIEIKTKPEIKAKPKTKKKPKQEMLVA